MTRVRITGPKNILKEVSSELYTLNVVHLNPYKKNSSDFFDLGQSFSEAQDYSSTLVNLRSILSYLKIEKKFVEKKVPDLKKAQKEFESLHIEFKEIKEELDLAGKEKDLILSKLQEPMLDLGIKASSLKGFSSVKIFKGVAEEGFDDAIRKEIGASHIVKKPAGKQLIFALAVPLKNEEKARQILQNYSFTESISDFDESREELQKMLEKEEREIENAEKKRESFRSKNSHFLGSFELTLSELIEVAESPLQFATSLRSFAISGWIPSEKLKKLKRNISAAAKEKIHIEEFKADETAPIELNNPVPTNSFEMFLDLYSLPKYYDFDPTVLMFLTFPLFFGFMLGDVAYGLIIFLLFYSIKRKLQHPSRAMRAFFNVMMISSISTIFFGFIFGEFMGVEFMHYPLLNRVHDVTTMLIISVLVGLVHVNIGFLLKAYNAFNKHGVVDAITEGISWMIFEIGIALVGLEMLAITEGTMLIGGVVILAALALIVKGEGAIGIIELPSLFGHTLSYARLFGIGMASVQLALVVNKFAGDFFAMGIIYWIPAILILLIGHIINIFLGVLGPFIQGMRLHYVEFFTKFYKGGGIRYVPFGSRNGDV